MNVMVHEQICSYKKDDRFDDRAKVHSDVYWNWFTNFVCQIIWLKILFSNVANG